jgi:hypothetical protein
VFPALVRCVKIVRVIVTVRKMKMEMNISLNESRVLPKHTLHSKQ